MAFLTVCYYSKGRQNVHFKHQACRVYDCLSGIFTERTAKHCTVLTNAPSFIYFYLSLFSLSKEARFYRLSLKCSEPSALAKKLICAKLTTSSPLLHKLVRSDHRNERGFQNLTAVNVLTLDSASPAFFN